MIDFDIYLITDSKLFASETDFYSAIDKALQAGIKAIALREKDMPIRRLMQMAYCLRELTYRHKARLFINDRLDVALACHADGVHLPQSGIPTHLVKKMVKDTMLIGVSTHSTLEALDASQSGADFITFGPVFETPSKMQYGKPVGIKSLQKALKCTNIPVFAIGGIKPHNTAKVLKTGAKGIALISGILAQPDIKSAVKDYKKHFIKNPLRRSINDKD